MTKKLLFVVAIMCVMTFAVMAADVTGKWTAEQPGRNGGAPRVTTFTFKASGATLTGTMVAPGRGGAAGTEVTIADGKVDGNNISFKVTTQGRGGEMTMEYTGTLDGDSLKLSTSRPGQDGTPQKIEMTAKRATT